MQLRKSIQTLIRYTAIVNLILLLQRVSAGEPQAAASEAIESPNFMCDVPAFGAKGDGKKLDTEGINRAIEACSAQGGGKVLFPPGRYRSGTVHLRSHVALFLDAGAMLIGAT